jgi:hypothetical protein
MSATIDIPKDPRFFLEDFSVPEVIIRTVSLPFYDRVLALNSCGASGTNASVGSSFYNQQSVLQEKKLSIEGEIGQIRNNLLQLSRDVLSGRQISIGPRVREALMNAQNQPVIEDDLDSWVDRIVTEDSV